MASPSVSYFVKFPVNGTNIFPIANSPTGGHLMTEYNLRSRETVPVGPIATGESIQYHAGQSYCHDEDSFKVSLAEGLQSTVIQIAPGRAIVNGHYIESLVPINIDLSDLTYVGEICIGLKVMYSTSATMSGAIRPENEDNLYEGIQVVVAPTANFILPVDSPANEAAVTAHLKLASLRYMNGAIQGGIIYDNYPERCQFTTAERIGGIKESLEGEYIKFTGLDSNKLYVVAPRVENGMCEATGTLMVWGDGSGFSWKSSAQARDAVVAPKALFETSNGVVQLRIPYKAPDATWTDGHGKYFYYPDVKLPLPNADYQTGKIGLVTPEYTRNIKDIGNQINNFYHLPNGKQRQYVDSIGTIEDLPEINQTGWNAGDYILVRVDNVVYQSNELTRAPSTIYVVLPGLVNQVTKVNNPTDGVKLYTVEDSTFDVSEWDSHLQKTEGGQTVSYSGLNLTSAGYRGVVNSDYFVIKKDDNTQYYYKVSQTGAKEYSQAISLTGEVSLATTEVIGGFKNVDETDLDSGYVFLDEDGHLKVLDYTLLRSGVLAYQLGENFEATAGASISTIQEQLDDYVNERVAFPNDRQKKGEENTFSPNNPKVIHVTITLPEYDANDSEDGTVINIHDIDSRFGSSVYLHILGKGDSNYTINIINCEKIRIDNNIIGDADNPPVVNIFDSCLFYDASTLAQLNNISGLSLWHERYYETNTFGVVSFDTTLDDGLDANVEDLTVTLNSAPSLDSSADLWSTVVNNDNHFAYGLYQVTFNQSGNIVGFGLAVKNETSSNISDGKYLIVEDFQLPNAAIGSGLPYPENRIQDQLKITGHFTTGYSTKISGSTYRYRINETDFSAVTQWYDYSTLSNDGNPVLKSGKISFLVDSYTVTNYAGVSDPSASSVIESIMPTSPHLFLGGAIAKSSDLFS